MIVKDDPKISNGLQDFVLLGAVEEKVEILGQKFIMKTVPAASIRQIVTDTTGLDIQARDKIYKIETLSRSIHSINGKSPFPTNVEQESKLTPSEVVNEMRKILGSLEQPIIDLLYEAYNGIVEKQNEFIDELKKKYAPKKKSSTDSGTS